MHFLAFHQVRAGASAGSRTMPSKAMQKPLLGLRDLPNGNLMGIYNAEISAGSLMLPESRRIARLLLTGPSRSSGSMPSSLTTCCRRRRLLRPAG
jgi:hypothetical protein